MNREGGGEEEQRGCKEEGAIWGLAEEPINRKKQSDARETTSASSSFGKRLAENIIVKRFIFIYLWRLFATTKVYAE